MTMSDVALESGQLSNTTAMKMIELRRMRVYDEMRKLNIEETEESVRLQVSVMGILKNDPDHVQLLPPLPLFSLPARQRTLQQT